MPERTYVPGEPFCNHCGYSLTGAVDSSKCPECGRPLVEVLVRRNDPVGRRFRSDVTLFGWPLVHIALGPAPGEKVGRAKGLIAIGDTATGLIAIGGYARGLVAVGGMAIGGATFGGLSFGLFSAIGGLAVGGMASGGGAAGGLASGGLAAGYGASGGLPLGYYAMGGAPLGQHVVGPGANSSEAITFFQDMSWFFGSGAATGFLQPMITCAALTLLLAVGVAFLTMIAYARGGGGGSSGAGNLAG